MYNEVKKTLNCSCKKYFMGITLGFCNTDGTLTKNKGDICDFLYGVPHCVLRLTFVLSQSDSFFTLISRIDVNTYAGVDRSKVIGHLNHMDPVPSVGAVAYKVMCLR